MNDLILFLFLVDAVLCIILFVKIWGMTGDVRRLEKRFCHSEPVRKKLASLYLCGEYDEAYSVINRYLAGEIDRRFFTLSRNDLEYKKRYEEEISCLIGKFSGFYEMIGKEIPENIKNVTFDSYSKLV